MKDLIVLASDDDMRFALEGLLSRPEALGIRRIRHDIFVEPEHDPACALRGVDFLSLFVKQYDKGLLIFDHEGCGKENRTRIELQNALNKEFENKGWVKGQARAIVISPELENWVWSASPHVDQIAGWEGHKPSLRDWLIERQWISTSRSKPVRPKEAFEAALQEVKKPRSASLYKQLAEKVSLRGCIDDSFREFLTILQRWFPELPEAKSRNSPGKG